MQILSPKDQENIIVQKANYSFMVRIKNNTKYSIPLSNVQMDIEVYSLSDKTHQEHCEKVKERIRRQISSQLEKQNEDHNKAVFGIFSLRQNKSSSLISGGDAHDFAIDLGPLSRNEIFKKTSNHIFNVVMSVNGQEKRQFQLNWLNSKDNTLTEKKTPSVIKNTQQDKPRKVNLPQANLVCNESTPIFIHNLPHVDNKLQLLLQYESDIPKAFNIANFVSSIKIVISENNLENYVFTKIQTALQIDCSEIFIQDLNHSTRTIHLNLPIKYVSNLQTGNFEFCIVIDMCTTFSQSIKCEVPIVMEQLPMFPGHVVLDFGTTNSACVYFNPSAGQPTFPDRFLSPAQSKSLQDTFEWLMMELEEKSLQAYEEYEILAKSFINCARDKWRETEGGKCSSFEDIRQYLRQLHQQEDSLSISTDRADILVAWGVHQYQHLRQQYVSTDEYRYQKASDVLADLYYKCLNRIIDIDIQEDCQIFLPELERGNKEGKISSTVRMDDLAPTETDSQNNLIDPANSQIKMGTAIEQTMNEVDYAKNDLETANLKTRDNQDPIHTVFVSGIKRWIGQKNKAYFVDMKNKIFRDTYDPICTTAIQYLLTKVEQSIGSKKQRINDLVVTYPANLSQQRRQVLQKIVQGLGVQNVDMSFDEATAAALYYMWRELFTDLYAGIDGFLARSWCRIEDRQDYKGKTEKRKVYFQNILLYDIGGGTTDIALLEVAIEQLPLFAESEQIDAGRYFIIRPKILGLTGRENFGGDNITLCIFRIIKSKLATIVAQKLLEHPDQFPPAQQEILDAFKKNHDIFTHWFSCSSSDYEKNYQDIRDDINFLIPTDFNNRPERQSAFLELWNEAEKIKKILSLSKQDSPDRKEITVAATSGNFNAVISHHSLNLLDHELNIEISRSEMERLISKDIKGTFVKARNLCIGQDPLTKKPIIEHYIDRIILAGSSSHLRLVRDVIPQKTLGKPFFVQGYNKKLPAPFKLGNDNLIFNPKDAKLAVARGACMPRYFKRVKVNPKDPQIRDRLREGISYLDFDIDNVRNYIPYTLTYNTGTGKQIVFEAGQRMCLMDKNNKRMFARSYVSPSETLFCYQIENVNQLKSGGGEYYCQFEILDAIKKHHGKDTESAKELLSKYICYMEFDDNRILSCYLYTNTDGNAESRYRNQKARKQLKAQEIFDILCTKDAKDNVIWKEDATLSYSNNAINMEKNGELMNTKSLGIHTDSCIAIDIPFRQEVFFFSGDTILWHIDLSDYQVISPDQVKIKIRIKPEKSPELEYSVFDPDFEAPDCNHKVPSSLETTRRSLPFNPFKGDE